jgi:curved DNA-binding protein CbpA
VRSAYQARSRLLAPQVLASVPAKVLKAADAAKVAVDEAWRVLGDPAARQLYAARSGPEGTGRVSTGPSRFHPDRAGGCMAGESARTWSWRPWPT